MKKLVLLVVFCASMFANDKVILSMKKLEDGMSKIQMGYLYNNKELIIDGLNDITKGNVLFKKGNLESYLPKNKRHMLKRSLMHSKKIDKEVDLMKKSIGKNKIYDSLKHHIEIIKACTDCHAVVRSW